MVSVGDSAEINVFNVRGTRFQRIHTTNGTRLQLNRECSAALMA